MKKRKYILHVDEQLTAIIKSGDYSIGAVQHIPYKEKEQMANEIAEHVLIVHDDSCMFESHEYDKMFRLMVAKYYTDIDTEDVDEYELIDFMTYTGLWNELFSFIESDVSVVIDIYQSIVSNVIATYADDKCLTKALRTSFGFLFNGEDITESLAKAEAMKNTVYDAIGAYRQLDKEQSEKINNGKLNLGGAIINFAKKPNQT